MSAFSCCLIWHTDMEKSRAKTRALHFRSFSSGRLPKELSSIFFLCQNDEKKQSFSYECPAPTTWKICPLATTLLYRLYFSICTFHWQWSRAKLRAEAISPRKCILHYILCMQGSVKGHKDEKSVKNGENYTYRVFFSHQQILFWNMDLVTRYFKCNDNETRFMNMLHYGIQQFLFLNLFRYR